MQQPATAVPTAPAPPYVALQGQRLLVTGAGGFIGGALLRRLAAEGLDVVGTVRTAAEARSLRAQGLEADVLDLAAAIPFEPILERVDTVFQIAAMFQETEHGEAAYHRVNVEGASKLCRAAARTGVKRFVHCSTVGVYGDVQELPCRENSPFNPMDAYHRTKLAGELAILELAESLPADGMVVTVNRPAMVYGPGDLRMLRLFRAVLRRRFVMLGSGSVLAHLGYIDDQVESFALSAIAPRARVHRQAFNIASDHPVALNDLVRVIAEEGGVPPPRLHAPVVPFLLAGRACEALCRPFGVRPPLSPRRVGFFTHNRAFDLSKAHEQLGYRSRWDLRRGVRHTIAWYREQSLL